MKITHSLPFVLVINIFVLSQTEVPNCNDKYSEGSMTLTQHGGKYLTASGDLKVLVVFAKFKGDTTANQLWPADSYPLEMNNFIDPDMQKGSTHFLNLTNYYNQMSFGNFRVTGKAIGVETPYPISHYIFGSAQYPDRAVANTAILKVVENSIDYTEYDNWKYVSDYHHINEPDGIIDMIIVIWRGLVFSTNWSGEMSLGYGSEFWVENYQKRIKMCHGGNLESGSNGSGVTVQYWGERTPERTFKVAIHEVAHWLIQVEHPYNNFSHTFWGMLTLGSEGICVNALERERLGWLTPIPIEGSIPGATISDFISTPSAYKYHPPNGQAGEMYYFENHQQISIYDNGISNRNDKGIFILHFANDFYSGDCVRILTSDGFWNWDVPVHKDCWGNDLPGFKKVFVNRNGFGNRDKITVDNFNPEFLYSYVNEDKQSECHDWLHGYGFNNSFNTYFNDVFSSLSNPPARTCDGQLVDFLMEVINQSGSIITARFETQNALEGKPSKPALGKDPRTLDSENESGIIKLAWGADFWDGFPIEPDVNWSELQMKVGTEGWSTIYSGANRFWNDSDYVYQSEDTFSVSFRVSIRDSQNKWSIWSDVYKTSKTINTTSSNDRNEEQITEFQLSQNYPNPFNPKTVIKYQLPRESKVVIKIYDILGSEVIELLNDKKEAGIYEVELNAENLSSGTYIYRIVAESFVGTKKMILIK